MSQLKNDEPYALEPNFERGAITLMCRSPRTYGRVGVHLEADLLGAPEAKHAIRAAHDINRELGHGPNSLLIVLQHLKSEVFKGGVTYEELKAVAAWFDDAEDLGLPNEEETVAKLTPIVQFRLRHQAVQAAIDTFGKGGDLSRVTELESKALRVGQVDTSVGTILGPDSFAEIAQLKMMTRLPVGVFELDNELEGGLQKGGLGVVIADTGGGKSVFMSHVTAFTLLKGQIPIVAYATLELPRPMVLARIKSAMTDIPINAIIEKPERALAPLQKLDGRIGRLVVREFTAQATTVEDIKDWVDRIEQLLGAPVGLLVVDYADKLVATTKKGEMTNEYKQGLVVFEGLRLFSDEKQLFTWTGSQAARQKDSSKRNKRLDVGDVSDSMHKVRVPDLVITLNPLEEDGQAREIKFFIAKHRTAKARMSIGPLPTDFEHGRIAPMTTIATLIGGAP